MKRVLQHMMFSLITFIKRTYILTDNVFTVRVYTAVLMMAATSLPQTNIEVAADVA